MRWMTGLEEREMALNTAVKGPAGGTGQQAAQTARAMVLLGWPGRTLWPAEVHRRWLNQAATAAADLSIPAADRLALTVDWITALLDLGEDSGWTAAARLPGDAAAPAEVKELLRGRLNLGDAAMRWGRYEDARRRLSDALGLAGRHHHAHLRDLMLMTLAHLDWFAGCWTGLGQRAGALAALGEPLVHPDAVLVGGHLDAAAGRSRPAEAKFRYVLDEQQRRGVVYRSGEAAAALARVQLAEGRAEEARAVTDAPMRVIAAKGIWLWATELAPVRVQALAATGRLAEAASLVAAFGRGLRGHSAPASRAALVTCQAILAEGRGKPGRAAALFGDAAAAWQALPRPHAALLAAERRGHCLLAAGQRGGGQSALIETYHGLACLPAGADAARVLLALREHGMDIDRPTGPAGLPPGRAAGDRIRLSPAAPDWAAAAQAWATAGPPAAEPGRQRAGHDAGQGLPVSAATGLARAARSLRIAGQIEHAYPGYHVWVSDHGWWYATRTRPWARGQSATVHGPGPRELTDALAAEEAAIIGRAMAGAW